MIAVGKVSMYINLQDNSLMPLLHGALSFHEVIPL